MWNRDSVIDMTPYRTLISHSLSLHYIRTYTCMNYAGASAYDAAFECKSWHTDWKIAQIFTLSINFQLTSSHPLSFFLFQRSVGTFFPSLFLLLLYSFVSFANGFFFAALHAYNTTLHNLMPAFWPIRHNMMACLAFLSFFLCMSVPLCLYK